GRGVPGRAERWVVVAVDELGELRAIETPQPGAEPLERGSFLPAGEPSDLLHHRLPVRPDAQIAAVGEARPVRRVETPERDMVVEPGAGGGKGLLEQADHGQDSGPRIDPEATVLDDAGAPARHRFPVDHDDLVAAPGE